MARTIFGLMGAVAALAPETVLEAVESVGLEDPEAATAREWVVPGIRAEGAVVTAASVRGGRSYGLLLALTGITGAVVAAVPRH